MKSKYLKQQKVKRKIIDVNEDNMTLSKRQKIYGKTKLLVDEMFYSIQTEGILAGTPAFFVRLFGCNLGKKQCPWCDTLQEKQPKKIAIKKIISRIESRSASFLVVLTGGEPFLQDITPLADTIIRKGWLLQVETNGTLSLSDFPFVPPNASIHNSIIVCSPKTKDVHDDIKEYATCFKYVIEAGKQEKDGLPKGLYRPDNKAKILVSPCFAEDKKETKNNIQAAVNVCKVYGYHLSLQYHKFIGVR